MSLILNSLIMITITSIIIFTLKKIKEMYKLKKFICKSLDTFLLINIVDYQDFNYFNKIIIKDPKNKNYNETEINIKKNEIKLPIFGFKNKKFLEREISIANSDRTIFKTFKIYIYKNFLNNINIYLNNVSDKYYYSEIIFYGKNIENKIKLNDLVYNNFNLKKRIRCIILNIEQNKLFDIIKNNNYKDELNLKIQQILTNVSNKNLLINIFMGNNKSNVLIFTEEEKALIIATEEEKKILSELYRLINKNINDEKEINKLCKSYKDHLLKKNKIFGLNIENIPDNLKNQTLCSYINQGIKCF